jgi:hypothetical protein
MIRRALLVLCLLLAGCDLAGATPTPVPTPAGGALFSGVGNENTGPFSLEAGNYTLTWQATNSPGTGAAECYFIVNLNGVASATNITQLLNTSVPVGTHTGTNAAYNIPAGRYYLAIKTPCDQWTLTLTPQP